MSRLWVGDQIEADFSKLTTSVGECIEQALKAMRVYLQEGETSKVRKLNQGVHDKESEADDIRREIVNNIIKGSLMPHPRSDILKLVEAIDDIADHVEDILDEIIFLHLDFCCLNEEKLKDMTELLEKQYKKMTKGVDVLFEDMSQALIYAGEMENIESEIDGIEEEITREVGQIREYDRR